MEKNREWRNSNAAKVKKKGTDKGGNKNTELKSKGRTKNKVRIRREELVGGEILYGQSANVLGR